MTTWVLILFFFTGGSVSTAEFASQAACEHALAAAQAVKSNSRHPDVQGVCVPKQ